MSGNKPVLVILGFVLMTLAVIGLQVSTIEAKLNTNTKNVCNIFIENKKVILIDGDC